MNRLTKIILEREDVLPAIVVAAFLVLGALFSLFMTALIKYGYVV